MIEINLIPPENRKKKKSPMMGGFKIPLEIVIGSVGGVIVFLVALHIVLIVVIGTKFAQHEALKREWEEIKPAKENIDSIINEMKTIQNSFKAVEKISGVNGVLWSKKLNSISDSLPRGVWLRKISVTEENLKIEGNAISKNSDEMTNVHKFTANLKAHEGFMDHFEDFELGSIQRKSINNTEIAEFSITLSYERPEVEEEKEVKKETKQKAKPKAKPKGKKK